MKRIIKHLVLVLVLLMPCMAGKALAANSPDFIVYYNSGKAVKLTSGKSIMLKKGDPLAAADRIGIPAGTQLVLVCQSYQAIQLNGKQTISVKSLLGKCSDKAASFSSSYFKYIWEGFSHHHSAPETEPRHYMKTTGAVSRGNFAFNIGADTINYLNGPLTIRWLPATKLLGGTVYDRPSGGRPLGIIKEADRLKIDSVAALLSGAGNYYLQLNGLGKRMYLHVWEKAGYDIAVNALLSSVPKIKGPERLYLTGYVMEEHHFLAEAAKNYKMAYQLEPSNPNYRSANNKFNE